MAFFCILNIMIHKPIIFNLFSAFLFTTGLLLCVNCSSSKKAMSFSANEQSAFNQIKGDTVTIASDVTAYEIIIIEPGFNFWLNSIARPEGYYSQSFLENRNMIMVSEWNRRATLPFQFDPALYQMQIDYLQHIDYGYEVNYKLYNYFIYFQRKYNQRLASFLPRI